MTTAEAGAKSPSELIDDRIASLDDWRGAALAKIRALIREAEADVVEEWKWRGVPTWYAGGKIVCTGETYKDKVKLTFAKGASLSDPKAQFNASLEGNARRAIDIGAGDRIDEDGLKSLFAAAAALNMARS